MGKHYRGKHRLAQPLRNRIGAATAVVAFGLVGGAALTPLASAAPAPATQQVALQAYSAPLLSDPVRHDNDRDRARGDRDRDRHFRGPIRRGHWDNVCGPHRIWSPRLHRTIVVHSCNRQWRNW